MGIRFRANLVLFVKSYFRIPIGWSDLKLAQFKLTIEDGILLHLFHYIKLQDDFAAPSEITQPGIADAIGIRRSHVSYALKGLKGKGQVVEHIAHIKDVKRKRKIYLLTQGGIDYARKIKIALEQRTVPLMDDAGVIKDIKISEIPKETNIHLPIFQILDLVSTKGFIHINSEDRSEPDGEISRSSEPEKPGLVTFIDNMVPPIRFVGRKSEVQLIKKWVTAKVPRIIVVKGIPGIGKTTLAARIMKDFECDGNHNLFWHQLHDWDSLRSILSELGEFLFQIGRQKLRFYLDREAPIELAEVSKIIGGELEGVNAILVFDDFQKINETIKPLFRILAELLGSNKFAHINVLVLTRGATGFYDRRKVAIKKLVAELELEGLDPNETRELLDFNEIQEPDLDKIFKLTGGHPLSLELLNIHLVKKVESGQFNGLDRKLDIDELLKEKHDITKYVHEEVFQRLFPGEKKLLSRVAVFRYPVLPEAFFVDDELDYECIDSLVGKSLLHETTTGYDIHELIREFFYHRLTPKLKTEYHLDAANYYSSELELSSPTANIDLTHTASTVLEAQYHLTRANDHENAGKLIAKYGDILINGGYTEELINILKELTADHVSDTTWPELLIHRGHILAVIGAWDDALECYMDSLEWCRKHNNKCGSARAYNAIGAIYFRKGSLQKAMEFYSKGLELANTEKDLLNQARLYSNMALIHWKNSELADAIELNIKSLELSKKMDDKQGIARAHNNLGIIYWEQRKLDKAEMEYNKSLEISKELGDKQTTAILYDNIGEVYRLKGELPKAVDYYRKSLELSEELGFKWQIAEVHCNLGIIHKGTDKKKSLEYLNMALDLYSKMGAKREVEKIRNIMNEE